jgi:hypothetical protein
MNRHIIRLGVALFLGSLVPACMGSMERERFCAETRCQREVHECETRAAEVCAQCLDAYEELVLSGQIPISSCEYSCSSRSCRSRCLPGDDTQCVRPGYRFSLPATDPAVEAACERAVARGMRCGEPTVSGSCSVNARVERPEAAAVYECLANTACGGSGDACVAGLPPGTLGDEICARVDQVCMGQTACGADDRPAFNHWQGWLRDDVVRAGRSCLEESSCDGLRACLAAWVATLSGETREERR